MARKNQRLINYHTSGTSMPNAADVHLGEIVVRHNDERPELLIELNNGQFATFIASGAISTALETLEKDVEGQIDSLEAQILSANTSNSEFEQYVKETYATSANTVAAIDTAKKASSAYTDSVVGAAKVEVYDSATTFATAAVSAANKTLSDKIDGVAAKVDKNASAITVVDEYVKGTYATSADTVAAIEAAREASSAYTDAVKVEVYNSATTFATAAVSAANKTLTDKIDAVDAKADKNASAITVVDKYVKETYATSADTVAAIDAAKKASSAYTDSVVGAAKVEVYNSATTFATAAVSAANKTLTDKIDGVADDVTTLSGNVHNTIETLESALTETINNKVATAYRYQGSCTYAELSGKEKVNGYVWNVTDANGNYPAGTNYAWSETENKWDALGGSVDLTPYYKTEDFEDFSEALEDRLDTIEAEIASANTSNSEFEKYVKDTYATSADTVAAIEAAREASSAYTDAVKVEVYNSATTFATAAVSAANKTLTDKIDAVDAKADKNASAITVLDEYVKETYATSANTVAAIDAAKKASSAYTDSVVGAAKVEVYDSATTFATAAVSAANKTLSDKIDGVAANVTTLSASTVTIESVANSAIQSATTNSGVNVVRKGTTLEFNFENMIIDCGDF